MREIYRPELKSLKQTLSTQKSDFQGQIYGEATDSSSEQSTPTKIHRIRLLYQDNPEQTKDRQIHWCEVAPKHKFSDISYSNYGANEVIIVDDNPSQYGFQPRKKIMLWILVIFITIAAIGNAVYWSSIQ